MIVQIFHFLGFNNVLLTRKYLSDAIEYVQLKAAAFHFFSFNLYPDKVMKNFKLSIAQYLLSSNLFISKRSLVRQIRCLQRIFCQDLYLTDIFLTQKPTFACARFIYFHVYFRIAGLDKWACCWKFEIHIFRYQNMILGS